VRRWAFIAIILLLFARRADATVYSWRDAQGALHISNDSDDVPAAQPEGVRKFTAKDPPRSAVAGLPSPAPADDPPGDYERGLEAGMQLGEQQVRMAAELAQTILAAMPPREPVASAAPPAVSIDYVPGPDELGVSAACAAGYLGCPYWYVGPALIGRRFFPHSHHPGMHGAGRGLFLAHDFAAHNNGLFPGRGFR
jgi:Domain of unknown function (DUF4124)